MYDYGDDVDEMIYQYIDTALWSSSCNGQVKDGHEPFCRGEYCGKSLQDMGLTREDFAPGQLVKIRKTVEDFVQLCEGEGDLLNGIDPGQAGHDLWLSRNGHGAGFWDRGLGQQGLDLHKWAKSMGEANLTVGDDGLVYHD